MRIGVIGCSNIANKAILPAIKESSFFDLAMVGSRSIDKGKEFATRFGCSYRSYEDVLNSDNVDAVYVSVPTGLHYEWGMKVIESGKHLLLEKPFTNNIDHTNDILKVAYEKNLIAMEGLAYVYHPYFNELKKLVNEGQIGEIRLIESSFGFPYLPITDIRNNALLGGGAILDNLIYPLSISLELLGINYQTFSFRKVMNKTLNIDDRGFLRIDWEEASANINYGFGFHYKNTIEIWGNDGIITVDRAFTKPKDMLAEIVIQNKVGKKIIEIPAANQFLFLLEAFYKKIKGIDISKRNESDDISNRMKIISHLYNH